MKCNSNRLSCIKVQINNMSILIFNVYMPCDEHNKNINVFNSTLDEIAVLIEKNSPAHYIIAGDFNCDFSRKIMFK